jgi:diguanylate cyclase (GGDEF)-like protein/PAS domain S-box-containing protein
MKVPMAVAPNLIKNHVTREERTSRYRDIVGSLPQILVVIDTQGQILDTCEGALDKLGWVTEEVIGHSVFEYLHPADHQTAALELMGEMEQSHAKSLSVVARIRHVDGRWFEFECYGTNRFDDPLVGGLLLSLRDVSGRRMSDRVLAAGDYLYSSLSTVASDSTTIFNSDGKRAYVSASLGAMLNYTVDELLAIPPEGLVHPEDRHLWKSATAKALSVDNGTARTEVRILRRDGSPLWIEATVVNLLKDSGVGGVVVHARDINDRRRMEERLRVQASRDTLTGLGNRFALMEHLAKISEHGDPSNESAGTQNHALLFCDLDGFKAINDAHDHATGDAVLCLVARAIESAISPGDFAARIGGDEFCIVGQRIESITQAAQLGQRVRTAITQLGTETYAIGVSIGIAWTAQRSIKAELLLNTADRAMYTAKRQGTNKIEAVTL